MFVEKQLRLTPALLRSLKKEPEYRGISFKKGCFLHFLLLAIALMLLGLTDKQFWSDIFYSIVVILNAGPRRSEHVLVYVALLILGVFPLIVLSLCWRVIQKIYYELRLNESQLMDDRKTQLANALHSTTGTRSFLQFDETSFTLPFEHGVLFCAADGSGGTVIIEVSTIVDDPLETLTNVSEIPRRLILESINSRWERVRTSRGKIAIRSIDLLDESNEAQWEALGISNRKRITRLPITCAYPHILDHRLK